MPDPWGGDNMSEYYNPCIYDNKGKNKDKNKDKGKDKKIKETIKSRKILYSPGFGAGWSSWCDNRDMKKFLLEYAPIIEYIEQGGKFTYDVLENNLHPLLKQLQEECTQKFGEAPYCGGAPQLRVLEVCGRVRINEYDGAESVEEEGEYSDWL